MNLHVKDPSGYSPMEQSILKALKIDRPMAVDQLKIAIYGNKEANAPRYWGITINGATKRLAEKLADNREPVRIVRNKLPGKHALETVLVKR